jgi:hypothetical protein
MIKVGYCVAYDWEFLNYSLPQVYQHADVICLSIDRNRQSWSGKPFSWDEDGFRKMVATVDVAGKIRVYEDDFYNPELLPMQNEVAQRNKIAAFLGDGGWHIQLDADEYFVDFKSFVDFLNTLKTDRKINVNCPMINLYKQVPEGMLWIKPGHFSEIEYFPIATRHPEYEFGRRNGHFNILTNFPILHQSWARSEDEMWEKLNNWGHSKDFDVQKYFGLWKNASARNFNTYKNFHHLRGEEWPSLALQTKGNTVEQLLTLKNEDFPLPISIRNLRQANSIWRSRARKIWKMVAR